MRIKRREIPILAANLGYVTVFGVLSLARLNYEFVIYTLVIVFFFVLIAVFQRKAEFSPAILWGLTVWGFLHMAGGHVYMGDKRLYDIIFVNVSAEHSVLKYDQIVHTFGFAVATLVCYHLLKPYLAKQRRGRVVLSALVGLMGMGLGALNEVIELGVMLVVPSTGVGGYYNTAFDLLFNMLGAVLAVGLINLRLARRDSASPA